MDTLTTIKAKRIIEASPEKSRPSAEIECTTCPNSMWFETSAELKCYCRVMYMLTWTTTEPTVIKACSGTEIGKEMKD